MATWAEFEALMAAGAELWHSEAAEREKADHADESERLESLDRIWDLVLGAESEGQGMIPTSAIRAALTKEPNAFVAHVCDGGCRR